MVPSPTNSEWAWHSCRINRLIRSTWWVVVAVENGRCYGFMGSERITVDFRIDGHYMGEEITVEGDPSIYYNIVSETPVAAVTVVKNCRDYLILRGKKEQLFMWLLTAAVTAVFFRLLRYFNTANIIPSTLSVATSFLGVYLTFRRNPYFALAYSVNDIILIVLWVWASISDIRYISVVVCFVVFLFNDIYGFISWHKMKKRQCE